jgi:hypothetical protein
MNHLDTASEAMTSPHLFGPFFAGKSWATWEASVKGAFAEPKSAAELALFKTVAGREPPNERVRELVCAVGRGGGKDSIASFLASYLAVTFKPKGKLRPGERAYVLCIAVDKAQAGIAFGYIKGYFEQIPALASLVTGIGPSSINLDNGVTIEVIINSYRSVRGRSILACIFDEAAFFRDENFASPDTETYNAVRPGLARVPGSMLIIISSVHKRSGLLYKKIKDCHGKNDPTTLAVMGSTTTSNPSFPQDIIDKRNVSTILRQPAFEFKLGFSAFGLAG